MSDVGPIQHVSIDVQGGAATQVGPIQQVGAGEAGPVQEVVVRAEGRAYPVVS